MANLRNRGKRSNAPKSCKTRGANSKTRSSVTQSDHKRTTANHGGNVGQNISYDSITSNDIEWYNKAKFLYDEATRVPFDAISGAPRSYRNSTAGLDPRSYSYESENVQTVEGIAASGIMVIDIVPTIGWSEGVNSPVNRAFTTMYGDIASKTTGAMQFQQADLAMLVTSLSSVAAILGSLKRYLEIATLYSPMNYYYPVDMLHALTGSEANAMDIIQNRDLYRARVNDLIFQFNQLRVPDFVSMYKRQYALSHNVYADADDVQAQVYMFRNTGFYEYLDTEAKLVWNDFNDFSFDGLMLAAQQALNAWRGSSDLPLIAGALIRAYPDNQFITLDMLQVDSKTYPVYDRNILWQINNSRTVRVNTATLDVTQDVANNFIICRPEGVMTTDLEKATFWRSWVYLNSYDHNESPEFIMESTRLIPTILPEAIGEEAYALDVTGTELVQKYTIFHRSGTTNVGEKDSALQSASITTNATANNPVLHTLAMLSQWHNAPRIDLWFPVSGQMTFLGTFGDLGDYTYLYPQQLQSLHEAALQSLYWVDSMTLKI